jgi:DHA1 family inner membrane transport protein
VTRTQRLLAYALGGYGLSMNGLSYFLVPLRAHELGASLTTIGVLLGVKALTETVFSVPLGAFIDRLGPRRAFLLGYGATAAIGLGFMTASSVVALFALQFGVGVVRPLGWVGGQSYVSGMRGEQHRSYDTGRFSFAANVGQMIAPSLAGVMASVVGTQRAFAVMVLYGVVFFVVALGLPGTRNGAREAGAPANRLSGFLQLFRIGDIRAAMLLTSTRLWITSVWIPFYPLYLVSTGTSTATAGSVVSAMAIGATSTSLLTGRIAKLGRPTSVTAAGLAIGCTGIALSPLLSAMPLPYLAAALVGFSQGLSLPMLISLVSSAAPSGQRSLALGLRSSVNQTAATAAPLIVAPVIGLAGLVTGFAVAGAIGATPLLAALAIARRSRRRADGCRDVEPLPRGDR